MSIPVLDLASLNISDLDRACAQWGFFALRGHGLDQNLIDEVMAQNEQFFSKSSAMKNRIRRSDTNAWGFYDAELTKNRRDWKEIIDIGPAVTDGLLAGSSPQWPDQKGFQDTMQTLTEELHSIALRLVDAIAEALGTQVNLRQAFDDHSSFLRLNYYPICPDPAPADAGFTPAQGELGISHHSDAGALTVLLQDAQPGLQIYSGKQWHTVRPLEDELIINIGDVVQVWSNDRYPAPLHRVLANAHASRISTPYFLNPSYDYSYAPLPDILCGDETAHYRAINWGEFRQQRSAGDYADFGEEIQISDFTLANNQV